MKTDKALMINEENFYLATRERKPYVVDSGGVKSFYAVCPECDNPIQLIGLLRRQQDSLPHRPYGRHIGDPLDHAVASFEGLRCLVRPQRHEGLGVLAVWHDERASYQAVLGPRPYKSRPEQVIRIGSRLWQGFVPAMFDLFGEQSPDHICLHLVRRRDNPQPGLTFVPLGRNSADILDACDETHGPSIPRVIDIDKE